MIQYSKFDNGGFVLHRVMINDHKYSAWYNVTGKVLAAERVSSDNRSTGAVPLDRCRLVAMKLARVGARYVG